MFTILTFIALPIFIIPLHFPQLISGARSAIDAQTTSGIGFCEGNYYYPKSKNTCPQGFNFGDRLPKCLCIKGAYRLYMSNCEVADGFATEVCTLLKESNITVRGVKLTRQVDWDKTGVVCERTTGTTTDWEYTPEHSRARLGVSSFYAINGRASSTFLKGSSKSYKQQICVERNATSSTQVCLYKHNDNLGKWTISKTMEVIVKPECPSGHDWIPLTPKRCFPPLTLLDSECQVPCFKHNIGGSGEVDPVMQRKVEDEEGNDFADLDFNITDPEPHIKHDNAYFDRKLNKYLMMQEIGIFPVTLVSTIPHGPNKSFELYTIMKDVVRNFCPSKYVPGNWLDQIYDLFHVLHHGDNFKYENDLTNDEFYWIKNILTKCKTNGTTIDLYDTPNVQRSQQSEKNTSLPDMEICQAAPLVQGYCKNNAVIEGKCVQVPIKELPSSYSDWKRKHYVPEANWLILDIVHVACFPQFNESYRMFHLLEQTVEKLFTLQIKNYWYYPTWTEKQKKLMLGMQADTIMHNLEYCTESAYQSRGRAPHRLIRPDLSKFLKRRKRNSESISGLYEIQCAKTKTDFRYPEECPNFNMRIAKNTLRKPFIVTPSSSANRNIV